MTNSIYLDHAATTPILKVARDAWEQAAIHWANPSSPHAAGRAARARLEQARSEMAAALGWRHDVIFTSGASESIEIAANRALPERQILLATEHPIVGHAFGARAETIPVRSDGLVNASAFERMLAGEPALVAIQQVNNETGVIQPLDELAPMIRAAGSLLLADCAQGASKIPLPDADFIAICAHKLGGPPGVGALLVRDLVSLKAVGGQEKGYRRGTQDVPNACAFAAAVAARPYDMPRLERLRQRLDDSVRACGGVVIADESPRLATIGAVALAGADKAALLVQCDLAGIAVSAGSACASGKAKASHVLEAMGVAPELAGGFLRISFGPDSSEAEVDAFISLFARLAERARAA